MHLVVELMPIAGGCTPRRQSVSGGARSIGISLSSGQRESMCGSCTAEMRSGGKEPCGTFATGTLKSRASQFSVAVDIIATEIDSKAKCGPAITVIAFPAAPEAS
jgi:hypothetical protein